MLRVPCPGMNRRARSFEEGISRAVKRDARDGPLGRM
jgi:hypothetical protein